MSQKISQNNQCDRTLLSYSKITVADATNEYMGSYMPCKKSELIKTKETTQKYTTVTT